MKRPRLVRWQDSRQPIAGWQMLDEDFVPPVACAAATVGFVVSETDDVLVLAQNIADYDEETMQGSGLMAIPRRCIVSQEEL